MSKGLVLLTGGSGAIGSAIRAHLLARQWQVEAPAHRDMGVADYMDVVERTKGKEYDAMILAHGTYGALGPLKLLDPYEWAEAMEVNVTGTVGLIHFVKVKGPIIVLVGARGGRIPLPERSSYAASKAALNAVIITGAAEGLSIYGLAPGPIPSKMQDTLLASQISDAVKADVRHELEHPADIGNTLKIVDFLLAGKGTSGSIYSARELNVIG